MLYRLWVKFVDLTVVNNRHLGVWILGLFLAFVLLFNVGKASASYPDSWYISKSEAVDDAYQIASDSYDWYPDSASASYQRVYGNSRRVIAVGNGFTFGAHRWKVLLQDDDSYLWLSIAGSRFDGLFNWRPI